MERTDAEELDLKRAIRELQETLVADLGRLLVTMFPMARKLQLISEEDELEQVFDRLAREAFDVPEVSKEHPDPKQIAAACFLGLSADLLAELETERHEGDVKEIGRAFLHVFPFAWGYMAAVCDARAATGRRGSEARRRDGDLTRAKLKEAVLPHRGRVSRSRAAELVADKAGLSVKRARELLFEIFPKDEWPEKDPKI